MGKQRVRTISWNKPAILFAAIVIFLLPIGAAYANSAAPPSVAWFTFDYTTVQTARLQGVQLIACLTTNCEQPVLLQQYGICKSAGCVESAPTLTGWPNDIGCATNICRSAAYPSHGGTDFRLVAQFSDRVRASEVVGKLPSGYGGVSAWRVIVQDTALSIESVAPPAVSIPNRSYPGKPLILFGASILVELLVAGVCFWRTIDPSYFESTVFIVFLVNLLSLPVVWLFFPSLGQFQSTANRNMGVITLLAAFIYAALLAAIYRSGKKRRGWVIALTILSLPVTVLFFLIVPSFLTGYVGGYISVQGLPASVTITASEIFAVVFEALLIMLLSKPSLPVRWVWITSLLMNAASFIVGLLLAGAMAPTPPLVPPEPPTPVTSIVSPTAAMLIKPVIWAKHGLKGETEYQMRKDGKNGNTSFIPIACSWKAEKIRTDPAGTDRSGGGRDTGLYFYAQYRKML
jgi:hypothetical protein